jgi:hypothetical protein
MAEMDDVLAELRHRIMGQLKPARPQHQETSGEGPAMTQPVNIEQRRGSAAVALRRLAHPGRDGSALVEEPVSEPINPERGGVVVGGDPISPLLRRLSLDMPELMEEVVAFIERRTAELKEREHGAAPEPTESVVPAALVRAAPSLQDDDTGIATISLRFDTQVLARIDAAARRQGISRTAWLHAAASKALE